uniref:tRNA-splicing endonuclease subunit Sen54 N-terminal domain-containing protein n=1 Tax=Parascaris univalens TaxID=6257 RepID=A0A915BHT5_PARUN
MGDKMKANRRERAPAVVDVYRQRNKQNLIVMEYVIGERMLKGLQLRSSRVSTMGMLRGGVHYFFPEEGVWLMETALGSVVHNGIALSVQQGYRLLESLGILWPKYAAYSYLKRSGYIVLPYNRPKNPEYFKPPTSKPELKVVSRFPADLMEQFPSLNANRQIRLASLHKRVAVASVFDISEHFPQPPTRPYKADRRAVHKEYVRPRYWPRFDDIARNSPSWAAYRQERAKLLSSVTSTQPSLQNASRTVNLDYDVFASDGTYKHSLIPPPLFRLLVVNDAMNQLPSSADLRELSSQLQGERLVLAVVHHAGIHFYDVDHRPLQL